MRKHRNGPIGTVQLVFLDKYAVVRDRSRGADRAGRPARPARTRRSSTSRDGVADAPRSHEAAHARCPLGNCDGSGWIVDADDVARPASAASGASRRRERAACASVLPPSTRASASIARRSPTWRASRSRARRSSSVREYVDELDDRTSPTAAGSGSRATSAPARRRSRWSSRSARSRPGTRSRSTRCRDCSRASAAPTTPTRASSPTSPSSIASPRSTCCTSTTSAPRSARDWVLEQLYAIVDERYATNRSMVVTTNLPVAELEEQIGRRTVSRLVEMCQWLAALRRRRALPRGLTGIRGDAFQPPSSRRARRRRLWRWR